ncbi:MAG: uncharacterized protein PWR13_629 [Archaeoglobi archaeon]|nr:DUF432 domain-containing protein [Candidatus Mnemosynella bozhongmuii]MDI3501991.1 uncharacterized protein [Archaeoglobi archaeon]MDK2781601.1 uncharacterized protein [Archaeoglobi archaeon]
MYGSYEIGELQLENEFFRIELKRRGDFFLYSRELRNGEEPQEKVIAADRGKLILTPVEPVNLPENVTNYMQIEFSKPVFIPPNESRVCYLKFPVEIGVFLAWRRSSEPIDVFSIERPKYTLYGEPRNGVVCRYWRSEVYGSFPNSDKFREGVLRLRIRNSANEWCSISSAVFDVYGMKIFYDDFIVFSDAEMRVISKKVAETQFYETQLRKGMKRALELYVARRVVMPRGKFTMEWGL